MYPKWKKEKYLVAVYHSGTEDLQRNTLNLLAYNKNRGVQLTAKRQKAQVQTQMQL